MSTIPEVQMPAGTARLEQDKNQEDEINEHIVDEALDQSFPASDPPSTSVPGTRLPSHSR